MITELVIAIAVMMGYSILYKDNPFYRALEHIVVGVLLAYSLYQGLNTLSQRIYTPLFVQGQWMSGVSIAFILGILVLTRFSKQVQYISRWPIAVMAGIGTGVAVSGTIGPMILSQISFTPIVGTDLWTVLNSLVMFAATFSVIFYFLFTIKHKGAVGGIARVSRYFMMVSFGAILATFTYDAATELTGFSYYLTSYPGYYILALSVAILVGYVLLKRGKT